MKPCWCHVAEVPSTHPRSLATEKRVGTMLELLEDEPRPRQKPKMEVLLVKSAEVRLGSNVQ